MGIICGYVVEKNEKDQKLNTDKSLMLIIIEQEIYFNNKNGNKPTLFRTYNFIWIYTVILRKNKNNKKTKIKFLKNRKKQDTKDNSELIYSDIISYKLVDLGGRFFEY